MSRRYLLILLVPICAGACAHEATPKRSTMAPPRVATPTSAPVVAPKKASPEQAQRNKYRNVLEAAIARAEAALVAFHPRHGRAMTAFHGVSQAQREPETSPVLLYAAYRQYNIALQHLRTALARTRAFLVAPCQRVSGPAAAKRRAHAAQMERLKRAHDQLLHAIYVLRHDRAAAPSAATSFWSYLAQVGPRLPGLF